MVGNIKFYLSLMLAHLTQFVIKKIAKSGGTSFAGKMVLKFNPEFLSDCKKYITKSIVTVTGTNGKSTTSGMIAHIFGQNNSVVHNFKGANMIQGITTTMALGINPSKTFDYAVLETDEAYLQVLYDYLPSDYLVVTNLFMDQLDRYGEITTTASYIKKAIDKNPKLKLILNADDPIVATFDRTDYAVYFGFEDVRYAEDFEHNVNPTKEIFNCLCGEPLEYEKRFFAQQGHYYCKKCGYKRHSCDYSAVATVHNNFTELNIKHDNYNYQFRVNLAGLYNAYNALAAITTALEHGFNQEEIQKALDSFKSVSGRTEKREILSHNAIIQLIKNPTGASEVMRTVDLKSRIIIAINDTYADGRDISWFWDTDFEQLKDAKYPIIASGMRAEDIALRLKYTGLTSDKIKIIHSIKDAITEAASGDESLTILPSYTVLTEINNIKF